MTTTVAVVGATGRMGRLTCRLIDESVDFQLFAQLSSLDPLSKLVGADIVVDFTQPAVSASVVEFALDNGSNVLVGTSGWSSERISSLRQRVRSDTGVLIVPNFSIGSVLVTAFSAMAAPYFESIEIVEAHHAGKMDSPSGTAVRTAEAIGAARGDIGPVVAPHTDQRARGQQVSSVPIHSLRMSGVDARQDVILGAAGEVVTLRHEVSSTASYEAGILMALAALRTATGVTVGLDSLIGMNVVPQPAAKGTR